MPSATTHTNLSGLIKKLLLSIDSYNSTDLSLETPSALTVDSLGERARLSINFALHEIYDLIKDSRYLEAYPTTKFSSVINRDYLELDQEAFLDDIDTILDTTNRIKLVKKTWRWYRMNFPDPFQETGTPGYYIRRNERLYLAPRPSAVINYTVDFRKFTEDLKLNGDFSLLPTHYDYWITQEAAVRWFEMEDPSSVPAIVIAERDSKRRTALESIFSNYDLVLQCGSNAEREDLGMLPYVRPVG